MKRIEIVISGSELDSLMTLLDQTDIEGYTYLKKVSGLGTHGARQSDNPFFEEENAVVIIACQEAQTHRVINELSPMLEDLGGICLISDCLSIEESLGFSCQH